MKVFVAGSRTIGDLNAEVRRYLDSIVEKRVPVLVGDASGADRAVQSYLHSKRYDLVEVFCAGSRCRNNVGAWPARNIPVSGNRRSFRYYATKDRAMAEEATHGLVVWDEKSAGTLMNIARLARQGKRVVVYRTPAKEFSVIDNWGDWRSLLSGCSPDLQRRIERESKAEAPVSAVSTDLSTDQSRLF
jgi:hypothetical protein